ncbi:DNA helicase, partial [Bertholletia excelsa]
SSFNRPNIYYEVRYKDLLDDPYADLANILKSSGDACAIVYCLERTTCDDLAAHLSKNGISCAAYHAGLNNKLRSSVLDDWISSRKRVVVATGIDRKDVRIVCHFNIPKSMEAFYQESGRAGRDQLPSRSLLYYGVDDCKKMQFILKNSKSKKEQPPSSQDDSSKKFLADFNQMFEYCEESGCRRRKILSCFGEQVPASLCNKSCDVCKHPNLVSRYLEELRTTYAFHQRNGSSQIYMSSSSNLLDEEPISEFWNRDDEASGSEEDISDPDDATNVVKGLVQSRLSSKSRLNEKIELLQRAEENYYQNKNPDKQSNKCTKNAVSQTMRESSKQRLLNALRQTQQRLSSIQIDLETSASFLENKCYEEYGKTGKSFYCSQVASTVRWLATTNPEGLMNRLGGSTSPAENKTIQEKSFSSSSSLLDQGPVEPINKKIQVQKLETTSSAFQNCFQDKEMPPILSFQEFIKSRKGKDKQLSISERQQHDTIPQDQEKRRRVQ